MVYNVKTPTGEIQIDAKSPCHAATWALKSIMSKRRKIAPALVVTQIGPKQYPEARSLHGK